MLRQFQLATNHFVLFFLPRPTLLYTHLYICTDRFIWPPVVGSVQCVIKIDFSQSDKQEIRRQRVEGTRAGRYAYLRIICVAPIPIIKIGYPRERMPKICIKSGKLEEMPRGSEEMQCSGCSLRCYKKMNGRGKVSNA